MRAEKLAIEEKRLKRESELQEQNERLHGLMAEEFENSFKENEMEEVDDVEDHQWHDDDTSYDEDPQSVQQKRDELRSNQQAKYD